MQDKNGQIVTTREEIKKVFEEFYMELFKTDKGNEIDEVIFKTIEAIAGTCENKKQNKINKEEVQNSINKLKNKSTTDVQGWSSKFLKNNGTDIVNSLIIIMNGNQQSKEW